MLVARGLMEGLLEPSKEMADMLEKCLLCGYCEARCALKNMEIITSMRHHLATKGLAAPVHQENVTKILRDGRLFEPQVVAKRQGNIPFYVGCLYRSRPKELSTVFSVLERLDIHPETGEETCCGYIVEATGFLEDFEKAKQQCEENLRQRKGDLTLTLCPTCTITLKEKYGLPVQHAIVTVRDKLREKSIAKRIKPLNLTVTYHDPCHLGRYCYLYEQPRKVIQSIPGIELVEMERNRMDAWCCGAGGGVSMGNREYALATARDRIEEALSTGAEALITSCPNCALILGDAEKRSKTSMPVEDIASFLCRSLVKS